MILIENIGDLIPAKVVGQLTQLNIDGVVANIAAAARNHWIKLAEKDTSHLRFEYITGIQPIEMQPGQATVALVGELAHLLEDGDPKILDMRTTLLGPNVPEAPFGRKGKRLAKAGHYYRAIPFRHMTLGRKDFPRGKTHGQEMGSAYAGHSAVADSKKLGREVYNRARRLEATRSAPGERVAYGGRLKAEIKVRGVKEKGRATIPLLKEHHKTHIYAGMIRQRKVYERATQTTFFTFRTISQAVNGESWMRGPITARKYAVEVQGFVQRLAPRAIQALLEEIA